MLKASGLRPQAPEIRPHNEERPAIFAARFLRERRRAHVTPKKPWVLLRSEAVIPPKQHLLNGFSPHMGTPALGGIGCGGLRHMNQRTLIFALAAVIVLVSGYVAGQEVSTLKPDALVVYEAVVLQSPQRILNRFGSNLCSAHNAATFVPRAG